jgi:phosphohistidine phosphatase
VARTLVLIRHAKAGQDAASDEARPLAPQGVSDAQAVGRWLAEQGITPDLVVVSPAIRARQTWRSAAGSFDKVPPTTIDPRIYENTDEAVLSVVNETDEDVTTLVVVGHNPSMHSVAVTLDDGENNDPARAALVESYPTAGIVVFGIEGAWAEVRMGTASLRHFAVPRG